ncbi:4-hydroxy-3-polyprenylbenzoate decarboxylase [Neorhizobium huautlense]|uniref:Flavin prenyltransferase UbiX n=1 Tax=Neorhizobium huautlense TaxID=67774 RepID=A0ABT9PM00_9HYPH|nr:UbiX family flavin prenyltransferase [Neorhizobium huautlense]MDP9835496.1 4-hydroxy-3-polyprenylbenzoate decarboxylase [Neorhizobium huautlense]
MSDPKKRVVLGVSGASGAAIALRIGKLLTDVPDVELHLVVSQAATRTLEHEVGPDALVRLIDLCHHHHAIEDIGASIASGSFRTVGMIVAPCSMRTLAGIASGLADNLLIRAADVQLKERRPLILLTRETPLHLGHLRNMVSVTEMGATVMPPVPAFYHRPETIADIIEHIARRAIDLLRLEALPLAKEWQG